MIDPEYIDNLDRFVQAQDPVLTSVLEELHAGQKQSHWMWFIFPQLRVLGRSPTAHYFGISDLEEAERYLAHRKLGPRLLQCSEALLALSERDPLKVMGHPDDLKLKSSMTLFAACTNGSPVFEHVLEKYYASAKDQLTLDQL